ncbi:MAG: PQQ-dependent sugar dehydrogenase [Planctomycetales bacterium]|nr:PQQ-dependent sugar dehydrogenase [Planctomycetales bacterium]
MRPSGILFAACTVIITFSPLGIIAGPMRAADPMPARVAPWTTSNVKGSPDPPLPYQAVRVFSGVQLNNPTDVDWLPDAGRWIATQNDGKVLSFTNDPENAKSTLVFDLNEIHGKRIPGAMAVKFHHDLQNHPWCFVTYRVLPNDPQGTRLARLRVIDPTVPTIDPTSLVVLAAWNSNGHTGGSMQFGPDGMLYVSTGDGQPPYPPDELNTGQDNSDLASVIMRIDVDHSTADRPYKIPDDNPFVGQKNVRDEIWAYGFRNPWKIAFDPDSGDLLAADVGWEMREMIHRVDRGRNHGWSVMEGSQSVKPDQQPVVPITPPLFEHTHLDSRSISGGHFWHNDRLPELKGAYIYGDWMTGKVWALKSEGDRVLWQKELVDTPLQVICFMLDPSGEVMIVGYDGTIYKLEPNSETIRATAFPNRLSQTGLFSDVVSQLPSEGVVEYEISAHHWADGTSSRQWIAIPDSEQLTLYERDDWQTGQSGGRFNFPSDTVVAKTVSYLVDPNDPATERRLETQMLHLLGDEWQAYNYVWNDSQTDAILQDNIATERKLEIVDANAAGGKRIQTWRHTSRSECLLCHIWAAGTVHGFWPEQLNIGSGDDNQLAKLTRLGLFREPIPTKPPIASPHENDQMLEARGRSYLALNCSTCHRPQGGGTANFNFDLTKSLQQNNYIGEIPAQGTFGIPDARVVAAGDPYRSIMLYRALKTGRGHMPQFGSNVIDRQGVLLLRDWIASMAKETDSVELRRHQILSLQQSESPDQILAEMLGTPGGALALSFACAENKFNDQLQNLIIRRGVGHEDSLVRDLFEQYLPEDQRVKRLGPTVDEQALLAGQGSAERGQTLFETANDVNCRLCHRIGSIGQNVGPDLSGIGLQMTPAEILASILRPSEKIDAKYRSRQVLTADGAVIVGIVLSEDANQLTIADSAGKTHLIDVDEIEATQLMTKSVMPDQLLSGMTAEQAIDLLAFLSSQRKPGPLHHKISTIRKTRDRIVVDGKRDEVGWQSADAVGDFVFTWWNEGDGPRQQTDARMLWDDDFLYVSFDCTDHDVQAVRSQRDSDVYRDDCVEVFASPEIDHPENYFNLEMNAIGSLLDNYRPTGEKPEKEWNPAGIRVAVAVNGTLNDPSDNDRGWTLEVAIPFQLFKDVLPSGRPVVGDRWRLNLNRLEDNMAVKSQWSQGDRNVPSFHMPEFFGFVEFAE